MLPKATRQALLRLRQLGEVATQKQLDSARRELARVRGRVERAHADLAARLDRKRRAEKRTPSTAGALLARAEFMSWARDDERSARAQLGEALAILRAAERAVDRARGQVEAALRAREATQAYEAALELAAARARSRRDDAASQDRWRRQTALPSGRLTRRKPRR